MVGFILRNTLSEFGSVARGVCQGRDEAILQNIVELTKVERDGDAATRMPEGRETVLTG